MCETPKSSVITSFRLQAQAGRSCQRNVCAQPSIKWEEQHPSTRPSTELHAQAGMSSNTCTVTCCWLPASSQMQTPTACWELRGDKHRVGCAMRCQCDTRYTAACQTAIKSRRAQQYEASYFSSHSTQERNADSTRPSLQVRLRPICPGTYTQYISTQTAHKRQERQPAAAWRSDIIIVGLCSTVLTTNNPEQCNAHCP
jgi:hypothetical protein